MEDNTRRSDLMKTAVAYVLFIVVLIVCGNVFVGCSHRIVSQAEFKDSTRVVIRERLVRDSVYFEVPKIIEKTVTKDTVSHLENDYGQSDAVVSNGMLFHSLETKPQRIYVPYEIPIHDTTTVTKYIEKSTEVVEVERNLTWWEQTQMKGFKVMIILLLAFLTVKYRKSILKLVKMIKL